MIDTTDNKGRAAFIDATTVIMKGVNTITVRDSIESIFPENPKDATRMQTLKLMEQSGSLDFWQEEGEDIYTCEDGDQI